MKHSVSAILFSIVLVFCSACGNQVSSLSDAQEQILRKTMHSLNNVNVAASSLADAGIQNGKAEGLSQQIVETLKQKCAVVKTTKQAGLISAGLSGTLCPIQFAVTGNQTEHGAVVNLDLKVKDTEFTEAYDIRAYNLTIEAQKEKNGSDIIATKLSVRGTVESQSQGQIAINQQLVITVASGSTKSVRISTEWGIDFETFRVTAQGELYASESSSWANFSINGKEYSQLEFENLFAATYTVSK